MVVSPTESIYRCPDFTMADILEAMQEIVALENKPRAKHPTFTLQVFWENQDRITKEEAKRVRLFL